MEDTRVLDMGTGIGSNLHYFGQRNPGVKFLGADYNLRKIEEATEIARDRGASSLSFEALDWFNLPKRLDSVFDGVFNIHTLCCFRHIEPAVKALCALHPRWVAFNSLFYEGPLDVMIHIRDHDNPVISDDNPDGDFNTFSLPRLRDVFAEQGYVTTAEPFHPPEALPRPAGGARGTYTVATDWHERSQFSGSVYLPWYFVFAEVK